VKIVVWTFSVILGLIVAGLAFIFNSPDYDLYFVKSGSMTPAINTGDVAIAGHRGVLF
jgi:signal peptidase I